MENQPTATGQKHPLFDGKVAGLGFVVLAILLYVLPQVLIMVLPFALVSFVVGLIVGMKAKYKPFVSGLSTGIIALLFVLFAILPSSRIGLQSFIQYALIILLPVLVGTLIGGKFNKSKSI